MGLSRTFSNKGGVEPSWINRFGAKGNSTRFEDFVFANTAYPIRGRNGMPFVYETDEEFPHLIVFTSVNSGTARMRIERFAIEYPNTITSDGTYSFIGSGKNNYVSSTKASVVGGDRKSVV